MFQDGQRLDVKDLLLKPEAVKMKNKQVGGSAAKTDRIPVEPFLAGRFASAPITVHLLSH